jgi:hypothetical protein
VYSERNIPVVSRRTSRYDPGCIMPGEQTETNDSRHGIGIAKKDVLDDWQ